MNLLFRIFGLLLFGSLAAAASASGGDEARIKRLIETRFPKAEVSHVAKSNVLGLYEAMVGDRLVYTDAKVNYLFLGEIIDIERMVSLTGERMQKLRVLPWNELPLDLAIKAVRGKGEREIAIFSDTDCPFCRRLENELKDMDNVTMYTFLLPIESLHPDAARKSKMIWCAADRAKAYYDFMLQNVMPISDVNCDSPVEKVIALGQKYRINATPTMVFRDGRIVSGALSRDALEKEFARVAEAGKPVGDSKSEAKKR